TMREGLVVSPVRSINSRIIQRRGSRPPAERSPLSLRLSWTEMRNPQKQIFAPIAQYLWISLGMVTALFAVMVGLLRWPVAQMYAIAAVGATSTLLIAWVTIRAIRSDAKRPGFQFALKTLMCWALPYFAVIAWIVTWKGPYDQDFLNANVKA